MTIYELLKQTTFDKISEKIQKFYNVNSIKEYAELYKHLHTISPNCSGQKLTIYITAYKETNSNDVTIVKRFNENDTSLYYDVSAYDSSDEVYSIAGCNHSDFLQYSIDNTTLKNFSFSTILAHCFYEISAYGIDLQHNH